MKKKFLSLLLVACMAVSAAPSVLAADRTQAADPDRVIPYSEEEDPMADPDFRGRDDTADTGDLISKNVGAGKTSYYSKYTERTYAVPEGYEIETGVDVSKWNGDIDWEKVKDDGISFAIIRVGNRSTGSSGSLMEDPLYDDNMQGAAEAGIPVGVYVFSQALTTEEAVAEANFALERVKGYDITLPIVMDYEFYSGGRLENADLSREQKTQNALAFCETIRAAGYEPMVYANKSFLEGELYASRVSAQAQIWLANYTTNTQYGGTYQYWQYTSEGQVAGIGTADCNFYFKQAEESKTAAELGAAPFTDVRNDRWYYEPAVFCYQNDLLKGTSTTEFSPNVSMTRAMFVQALYNYADPEEKAADTSFTDVEKGKWYYDAVCWAEENNITAGMGDGTFAPNENVTREQFIRLLFAYAGAEAPQDDSALDRFADRGDIAAWAVPSMCWAVENKVVVGMEEDGATILDPKGETTRAQAASVLKGYVENIVGQQPSDTPQPGDETQPSDDPQPDDTPQADDEIQADTDEADA
ncbi:MAG: GH25 family lysozyme [Eubacteriales bacterium]|nr:GH25 family lysozyme [Eubacteriales bacterium]